MITVPRGESPDLVNADAKIASEVWPAQVYACSLTMQSLPPSPLNALAHPSDFTLELLVGLATIPLLGGLVLQRHLTQGMQAMGLASEELLRGERLPIINPKNL